MSAIRRSVAALRITLTLLTLRAEYQQEHSADRDLHFDLRCGSGPKTWYKLGVHGDVGACNDRKCELIEVAHQYSSVPFGSAISGDGMYAHGP